MHQVSHIYTLHELCIKCAEGINFSVFKTLAVAIEEIAMHAKTIVYIMLNDDTY